MPIIRISAVLRSQPAESPRISSSQRPWRPSPAEQRRAKPHVSSHVSSPQAPYVQTVATSPRMSHTRLATLKCSQIRDYNASIHDDSVHHFATDMFGQTVYKQRPPDQKATSKHAVTARSSRQVMVANQAESSLHGNRRKSLQLSYFSSRDTSVHTNRKDSEVLVKEHGDLKSESKYSNKALCTPRSLGELRLPRTPRMYASASGILPSCSLSGGKNKPDSYLSNHQRYPIRAKQPAVPPVRDQSDAHPEQGATKSPKRVKEEPAESEEVEFPDFDSPFDIQQFEFSRKAFKKLIQDKIFWGRYEPDGHGSFKLRTRPKLLKIQQEAVQLAGGGKETGHRLAHHYDAAARHGDVFRSQTSSLLASKTSVRMWITLLVHTQICIKFGHMIDVLQQVKLSACWKACADIDITCLDLPSFCCCHSEDVQVQKTVARNKSTTRSACRPCSLNSPSPLTVMNATELFRKLISRLRPAFQKLIDHWRIKR